MILSPKARIASLIALIIGASAPYPAFAQHRSWLLPSDTIISGNDAWITFDGTMSDQLFYPGRAIRLSDVIITAPDGSIVAPQHVTMLASRSVFDLQLSQQGTYRIATLGSRTAARWDGPDGKPAYLKGGGSPEDFAAQVPKDAKNLEVSEVVSRLETFVTNGAPNTTALKPTGKDLEMVPITHPNDLVAGEAATFRLLIDGQPAAGVEIKIIRGAMRYRNSPDEIKATSGSDGSFSITWPEAGMYWLQANAEDDKPHLPQAKARRMSYTATLEVQAQ